MWRDVRARAVALDVASVTGITLVTAAVSQRWASLLLDAMFYASESVFGSAVTDRAVETSYYWTRLGYIVPVRALTTALGTWAGFEAFRILLIAGLAAIAGAPVPSARVHRLCLLGDGESGAAIPIMELSFKR